MLLTSETLSQYLFLRDKGEAGIRSVPIYRQCYATDIMYVGVDLKPLVA